MKLFKSKKEIKKFDLEKMEVAKFKSLHLIKGGSDPIDPKHKSTGNCDNQLENY
ncbi:hypothetical protein [Flavobacterium gelatinilyticum]|uniref:hypothetical protein n=1 Tax=Flavobacterium gelatinilyticum TaxID=3003260 RepID=UPI00248077C7|nr:hypothetical protein [Flavobacterium gelatinilyticum]